MDESNETSIDLESLRHAKASLLDVVHPSERRMVSIALDHLIDIHAEGRVRVTQIDGPTSVLRKAMREAWRSGVLAPLARSRDPLVRSLLLALPEAVVLEDCDGLSAQISQAASAVPGEAKGVAAHLARAQAYVASVPVILSAIGGLADLPRVFVKDDAVPPIDHRITTAARRMRQAFVRDIAALVDQVAKVAHRQTFGLSAGGPFTLASQILDDVPTSGVRRRDPSGTEWIERFSNALAADVVEGAAAKSVVSLLHRHPDLEISKISMKCDVTFKAKLDVRLTCGSATLTLTYRLDLLAGTLGREVFGLAQGAAAIPLEMQEVDMFLERAAPRTDAGEESVPRRRPMARRAGPVVGSRSLMR